MELNFKNIAFIIPSIEYGGAEIQVINQINYLVEKRVNVILIVIDRIKELREKISVSPDRVFELHFPVYQSYAQATLKAPVLVRKINGIIQEQKIEIAIANLPFAHYVMRMVKLYSLTRGGLGFKLLNYHHSLQYQESPLDNPFKKAFNIFNSLLARGTDAGNIFISEAARSDAEGHMYLKAPEVIFNAVPYKAVNEALARQYFENSDFKPAKYNIVLPGRLNAAKGHLFFISVLKSLIQEKKISVADIQFVIAGGGALATEILTDIREQGLQDFIHITGFVQNELLLSIISWADLIVIPSVHEGFGNVALEALMLNKLVLASDAGGLREIIKENENGFLFRRLDKQDCLGKLRFLYINRNMEVISKTEIEKDYHERFSYESHFQKLINKINSCAE